MKILDSIKSVFAKRDNHTLQVFANGWGQPLVLTAHKFGETMYLNAAQMLTDIFSEVIWTGIDTPKYRAWVDFVNRNGQRILLQMLRHKGYTVIGYSVMQSEGGVEYTFYELPENKYRVANNNGREYIECFDSSQLFYVLKTPTYEQTGYSDHWHCRGFIAMIDAVYNGATTTAERLGAYVVMSPKQDAVGGILLEKEKKDLEKELQQDYGMLNRQRQIMVMPRPMDSAVISLAQVDARMKEKATSAMLAIADRLKVPANQIALIDGGQSKSFANGSEYREGDIAKYRSFRRLLNATFFDMAAELGMQVNYTLENEPKTTQGQTIEGGANNVTASTKADVTKLGTDLLEVLTTDEKRAALGYAEKGGQSDDTILAKTLGVGGTQSLVEIAQSDTITNDEKRGYLKVLFGLTDEQINDIIKEA